MQSSIPELLTATKHKLLMRTPPYLSAQKPTMLQRQSLLIKQLSKCHTDYNNLVGIAQICHRAVLNHGSRLSHTLHFYKDTASICILF